MDDPTLKSRLGNGDKGSYIVCLRLEQATQAQIGKLGIHMFRPGFYYYIGSAFGPGGVAARCKHHLSISTSPRWHLDYLRRQCLVEQILFNTETIHYEHIWANAFTEAHIEIPMPGFGSSDCNCPTHLFFNTHKLDPRTFIKQALNLFNTDKKGG